MLQYIYPRELKQLYAHYANAQHSKMKDGLTESQIWKKAYQALKEEIFLSTGRKSLNLSEWIHFFVNELPLVCVSTIDLTLDQSIIDRVINASFTNQTLLSLPMLSVDTQKLCLLNLDGTLEHLDEQAFTKLVKSLDYDVSLRVLKDLFATVNTLTFTDARPFILSMIHYPIYKIDGLPLKKSDDGSHFDELITFKNGQLDCQSLTISDRSNSITKLIKSKGKSKQKITPFEDVASYIQLDAFDSEIEYPPLLLPPQINQTISLEDDLDAFFDEYFLTIADNDQIRALRIKQVMLASLLQLQTIRKAVFMHGKSGTGKSTLLNIFKSLHDEENVAIFNLANLNSDDAIVDLRGATLITGTDNPDLLQVSAVMSDRFRRIISHEPIDAFEKYKPRAKFINRAFMIQAMNDLPVVEFARSATNFLERVIVIHIDTKFRGTENEITDYYKKFLDKATHSKLIGYLFRTVPYFESIVSHPDDLELTEKIEESNSVQEFIEVCVENGLLLNAVVPINVLRALYLAWMKESYPSSNPLGKMKLNVRLNEELEVLGYRKTDCRSRLKTLIAIGAFNQNTCQIDQLLEHKFDKMLNATTAMYVHKTIDEEDIQNQTTCVFEQITKNAINKSSGYAKLEQMIYALQQKAQMTTNVQLLARLELISQSSDYQKVKDDINNLYEKFI